MTALNLQLDTRAQLHADWQQKGLLTGSFPLANPEWLSSLNSDWPLYESAITRNQAEGLFRVPYLLTEAITRVAHDPNILEVVSAALGTKELVMWGPNMQCGTPNEADLWHTDIESWLWPSLTLVVGLENCCAENSTHIIPSTHELSVQPWGAASNWKPERVLEAARRISPKCSTIMDFADFAAGRFYAFNAKCWHAGRGKAAAGRQLLLLHYQKASEPRVPYMADYEARTWFEHPATFIAVKGERDFEVNGEVYPTDGKEYRGTFQADFDYLE